ncbi:MAG TPA: hypothetical protein VGK20_01005 [Candidatus Binatia bacterium]|jgi:hypothetical protein
MALLRQLALATGLVLAAHVAAAEPLDCGQPFSGGAHPVTSDSLYILKSGVGLLECELCACDINGSGTITASDALGDLRLVVGLDVALDCPACATTTTTTTTSTTTTTVPACPAVTGLEKLVFNETFTCNERDFGGQAFCADLDSTDSFQFTYKGSGHYEARDVPDTGFVYTGTLACRTFSWHATSPDGYSESGSWKFAADLHSFFGSSFYVANDNSYSGACNETGVKSPTLAPHPLTVPPCP